MRRQLIASRALPLLAALLLAVGGCSSSAPRPGPSGPGGPSGSTAAPGSSNQTGPASTPGSDGGPAGGTTATSTPPGPGGTTSADGSLSGLTAECTAVIDAQVAINQLFGRPVGGGRPLTAAQVATVFDPIGPDIPSSLSDDIRTLHQAASRAVGKSDVAVATILAEQPVVDAMAKLSGYIKGCSPATS